MEPEEIISGYIERRQTGEDNLLRAAVGKLTADRTKELAQSIQSLHHQIPLTVSELRETISRNADKMIASNERLSISNEYYAKWMKWLTGALVFVGFVQVVITIIKYFFVT